MNVNFTSYSDADCVVTQTSAVVIGTNALKMHIRAKQDDATVWAEMTRASGEITATAVTDGTSVSVTISHDKLLKIPAGDYVHSLIMSKSDGTRTEIWRGTMTHNVGPTRWNDGT